MLAVKELDVQVAPWELSRGTGNTSSCSCCWLYMQYIVGMDSSIVTADNRYKSQVGVSSFIRSTLYGVHSQTPSAVRNLVQDILVKWRKGVCFPKPAPPGDPCDVLVAVKKGERSDVLSRERFLTALQMSAKASLSSGTWMCWVNEKVELRPNQIAAHMNRNSISGLSSYSFLQDSVSVKSTF